MPVTKSIIEDFEMANGTQVYVQSSVLGNITLSFDSNDSSFVIRLSKDETEKLTLTLRTVLEELRK